MDQKTVILLAAGAIALASYFVLPKTLRLWVMLIVLVSGVVAVLQNPAWGLGLFLFLMAVTLAARAIIEKKV